jgi:hypothetical protein
MVFVRARAIKNARARLAGASKFARASKTARASKVVRAGKTARASKFSLHKRISWLLVVGEGELRVRDFGPVAMLARQPHSHVTTRSRSCSSPPASRIHFKISLLEHCVVRAEGY